MNVSLEFTYNYVLLFFSEMYGQIISEKYNIDFLEQYNDGAL